MPGVTQATVNLETERTTVPGTADADALIAAIDKAGYVAKVIDAVATGTDDEAMARKDAERETLRRDLLIAAALTLPVLILELGSHTVPAMHHWVSHTLGMQTSWNLQFALTTLAP